VPFPDPSPPPSGFNQGNTLPIGSGYVLRKRIGRGGFGEVWQADAPGGLPVAVKFINRPLAAEESQRELQVLEVIKSLKNPFLLKTHAHWASEDRLIIVMELAEGSLRDRFRDCIAQDRPGIPASELLGYFREAAAAIDYMHDKAVLHRDVKPDNILLSEGHVLVADFGLVRLFKQDQTLSSSGTPPYMAPEAWRGKPVPASDQYSLACTWMEMRVGRRPFIGDNAEVVLGILTGEPDLTGLFLREQEVIRRAIEKDPAKRYSSCSHMVAALEQSLSGAANRPAPTMQPAPPLDAGMPTPSAPSPLPPGMRPSAVHVPATASKINVAPVDSILSGVNPKPGGSDRTDPLPPSQPGGWREKTPPPPPARGNRLVIVLVCLGVIILAVTVGVVVVLPKLLSGGGTAEGVTSSPVQPTTPTSHADALRVPPGFVAVGQEEVLDNGHRYARRIRPRDRDQPVFLFIQKKQPAEPASFYLMEGKLSAGLYAKLAGKVPGTSDQNWPIFNVSRDDAAKLAAGLGGRLPTALELDMAAGYWQRGDRLQPARGPNVAVNLKEPRPIDAPTDDISPLGVRDLSGNGEEWTSDDLPVGGKVYAVTRGRSFRAPTRVTFVDLEYRQKDVPPTQDPLKGSDWTSFRVAVDPPR
jgi:serine/threonine protein kinase/formylglycine-generating enzyme required for sulfatase activity